MAKEHGAHIPTANNGILKVIFLKAIKLISAFVIIGVFTTNTYAQLSAYHTYVNPYKKSGLQMPTFGAYFSAVPAKDGYLSANPSAMGNLIGTNIAIGKLYLFYLLSVFT